jgi:hypothetical protein
MTCAHDMQCRYDIFKQHPDQGPVWVGAVRGTEQVWKVLISLKSNSDDNYFARDASEGRILEMFIN